MQCEGERLAKKLSFDPSWRSLSSLGVSCISMCPSSETLLDFYIWISNQWHFSAGMNTPLGKLGHWWACVHFAVGGGVGLTCNQVLVGNHRVEKCWECKTKTWLSMLIPSDLLKNANCTLAGKPTLQSWTVTNSWKWYCGNVIGTSEICICRVAVCSLDAFFFLAQPGFF